jgi:glycosyltransferase involved in cell wall biosynthesis
MRVCFIIYGSIDQVTGGYAYDRRVVAALRAAGDDVQLLSLQQYSDFKRDDVRRRVLSGKPEVVVGDELCHRELAGIFRGIRAISYCGNPRPRSVLLVHHLSQWETGVPVASEGRVIKLADSIIVTSKDSAARLHAGFGVSSVVCVPGADHLPKLPRVPAPKGVLRLLYVGTWTERKGLLRLVEALRDCGEVCYELTIVGDAYRDEAYRQRVAACIDQAGLLKLRCTNLGVISDGELAEVYARHDVLVLPSV